MKARVTERDVHRYVAECAESIIEDDLNESGEYTDEAFEELRERAFDLMMQMSSDFRYDTEDYE